MCVCVCVRERERERKDDSRACVQRYGEKIIHGKRGKINGKIKKRKVELHNDTEHNILYCYKYIGIYHTRGMGIPAIL